MKTEAWVYDQNGSVIIHTGPKELDPGIRWIIEKEIAPGTYRARFELEDCLAYEALFIIDELPF